MTHCGASVMLEGVCCGLPLLTWPLFADQFINEQLALKVLGIGVSAGAKWALNEGGEEKFGVQVRRLEVKVAIEKVNVLVLSS